MGAWVGGMMPSLTAHHQGGQQPQCEHRPLHPVPPAGCCVGSSCPLGWGMWVSGRGDRCRVGAEGPREEAAGNAI